MAADTGDCSIFFYGSKEKLNELTLFMKEAWQTRCNSEGYEANRIDEYSWLEDYDEKWNAIHSLDRVNDLGYQFIPDFLKKVKEIFPEISIKGIVNHEWLICEGEEHMKITSDSNSTEVNCEEWCPKEVDWKELQYRNDIEEEDNLEESWISTEKEWKESLFCDSEPLQADWYELQSILAEQLVVGTKYDGRPANISKLFRGEDVFLVREKENIYDANAIEIRSKTGSLGYISAEIAAKLSPLLDRKIIECKATVIATMSKLEYVENIFHTKIKKDREKYAKELLLWVNIQIYKC